MTDGGEIGGGENAGIFMEGGDKPIEGGEGKSRDTVGEVNGGGIGGMATGSGGGGGIAGFKCVYE